MRVVPAGDDADATAGILTLLPTPRDGWYAAKTLWFADPSYTGPVLLRGKRLDEWGEVAFGMGRPHTLLVQIPPGPGINVVDGYRRWAGATWMRAPGCYGLQVDGTSFSMSLVVEVRFR